MGIECAKLLRKNFGEDSVILSDIIKPNEAVANSGPYIFADILDFKVSVHIMWTCYAYVISIIYILQGLQKIVVDHRVDWIIHFSALLSAIGEQNVPLAVR